MEWNILLCIERCWYHRWLDSDIWEYYYYLDFIGLNHCHVYLFDKVFIDKLLKRLSDMFDISSAMYLKSYLPPKRIVDQY